MPADQRPPSPGRVTGWRPDVGPGLGSVPELLRTCELSVVGRLPWSSNLTFLVTVEADGPEPLHAVYKPASGERSLWDFPDGLYRREVAAYELSEALGWGLVPPTVERVDGPFGPGSLQLFVEADYEQHYFTLSKPAATTSSSGPSAPSTWWPTTPTARAAMCSGGRRPSLGHRPRPVLPPEPQAPHRHLGLRRGAELPDVVPRRSRTAGRRLPTTSPATSPGRTG